MNRSLIRYVCLKLFLFQAGFVLGVRHADNKKPDYILHFAPTPNGTEDEPPIQDLEQLDVAWSKEHHKQIRRMLPGGIQVLGVSATFKQNKPITNIMFFIFCNPQMFVMSAKDIFTSSVGMTHVKKVLTAIGKVDDVPKGKNKKPSKKSL